MTNRVVTALLILLATIAIVGHAVVLFMSPPDRWREWMQLLVAQQVANTLNRQVRLGPVVDLTPLGVEARWLAVAETPEGLEAGLLLSAERMRLAFNLRAILRGVVSPAAGIGRVEVLNGWAHIVRDEAGDLNIEQLVPEPVEPVPPEARFQGIIVLNNTTIIYDDYAIETARGTMVALELAGVDAEIDMRTLGWVDIEATGRERLGRLGSFSIDGVSELDTGYAWATAEVGSIDAAYWFDTFVASDEVAVQRGRMNVTAKLGMMPQDDAPPELSVSALARGDDFSVTAAQLTGEQVIAGFLATVTMSGAEVHSLEARVASTSVEATGFIADFDSPVLNLTFQGNAERIEDLMRLAPDLDASVNEQIESLAVAGPVLVSGRVTGPLESANLSAEVQAPGSVRYASADFGAVSTGPVDLRFDLLDIGDPNIRGVAQIARAEAADLSPLQELLPETVEGPIEVTPLEGVVADVLWSTENPVLQTDLNIARMTLGDLVVEDLITGVAMAGDIIWLSDLTARPIGSRLSADAVVDIGAEGGPWAWASGTLEDLDLARLEGLPGVDLPEAVSGQFSGRFAAEIADGEPWVIAEAVLDDPAYGDYGTQSLTGIFVLDGDAVQVRGANFQDGLGAGWVRGVIPFEGEMMADFAVAGVDLAALREEFDLGVDRLQGEAFVTGSARGTFENPVIDATVRAFGVETGEYRVDAVIAKLSGDLQRMEVNDLFASSGRLVARVEGALTDVDIDEGNAGIDGTLTLAGPIDQRTLDLADIEGDDIAGAMRAEMDIGGTLQRPSAQGQISLDYGRYESIATDGAVMAVNLQGDVLELEQLRVPVGGATLTGEASITSLYDTPIVSASIRARDLTLQDLALWREVGLPLEGQVDLPYLSLQGPLDDLKGMAQIQATDLELGDNEIGAVSAWVVFDENALTLRRTIVDVAGGTLALEGSYRLDEQRIMPSVVEFDDVAMSELLQLGIPIAESFADGTAAAEGGVPLSQRLASLSMRLKGRVDGDLEIEGVIPEPSPVGTEAEEEMRRWLAALAGTLDVSIEDPSLDNRPLPDTLLRAEVADEPEVALQVEAAEEDALITADGTWRPDGTVAFLAEVSSFDLAGLRPWLPTVAETTGGRLNLTIQASGTVDDPNLIASVDIVEPELRGVQFDLIAAPIIRFSDNEVDIDSLVLREGDEELFVDGRIPFDWATMSVPSEGELAVVARADGTDLAILPPLIAEAMADSLLEAERIQQLLAVGSIDSLISISGTVRRPVLNGQLTVDASLIETPFMSAPIEDVALDVNFTGQGGATIVELDELTARVQSLIVEGSGTAEVSDYDLAVLHQNAYDLQLTVQAPRQDLVGDSLTARDVRGTVTLETTAPGLQLLTVDELGADFGDGSVLLDGTATLSSFVPSELTNNDFDMVLVADDARPRYRNIFLGTVDGRISFANPAPGEPAGIQGGMTVSHAVIGLPPLAGEAGAEMQGMPAAFPSPQMDVSLAIGQDVRVRTTGLTAPLEPTSRAVWVQGTPQRPNIQGQIEVQEGEATVTGGILNIQTAGVQFLLRPALGVRRREAPFELDLDGNVWATATQTIESTVVDGRQLEDVEILLQVSGTLPSNIHVQVSSSPPLAEEQLYALLGTAPFTGGDLTLAGDLEDVMTEQFVAALGAAFRHYVFQPFQEDLRELLGLSVFEVSFAFDQPVSVRLGGYLIEDLLVTYETSVGTGEEYELGVSYRVERQFELSYKTDESDDHRLLVEYVVRF